MNINVVVLLCETLVIFGSLVGVFKLFGKSGLFMWAGLAPVMANIMTVKNANIFGMNSTCGTVLFASIFLCTDIISEKYGAKESRKAVLIGVASSILFILSSQICLLYIPSEVDVMNDTLKNLLSLNLRVTIASMVCFLASNILDVIIYNKLKDKTSGKKMWLRNNISTIICNCAENFAFIFLAYVGIFDGATIISIALSTSVIELIVAVLDTPFLYLAKKIEKTEG